MNKKRILIITGICALLIASVSLVVVFSKKDNDSLNELEISALKESGRQTSLYFDKLLESNSNGLDQYISFALAYSVNELDKNSLTSKEIVDIIKKYFNLDIDGKKIEENGRSPLLVMNSISFNDESKIYTKDTTNYTQVDIAHTDVYVYLFDKATKKNGKYVITYKEYVINDPYKVLNYYEDKNGEDDTEPYDTSKILSYLKGKSSVNDLKKSISTDMVEEVSKYNKSYEVTYVAHEDKILIDSIK